MVHLCDLLACVLLEQAFQQHMMLFGCHTRQHAEAHRLALSQVASGMQHQTLDTHSLDQYMYGMGGEVEMNGRGGVEWVAEQTREGIGYVCIISAGSIPLNFLPPPVLPSFISLCPTAP